MSKRNTAIAAAALAFALGCEEPGERDREMDEDTISEENRERDIRVQEPRAEVDTNFEQGPGVGLDDEDRLAQGPQARQPGRAQTPRPHGQMGQQQQGQMGQQQQGQMGQEAGQIVAQPSERNFARTVSQLTREMRENDLEVVAQIRYDERTRQRTLRALEQARTGATGQRLEQQQPGTTGAQMGQRTGQQAMEQGEIGDVRLLVFRRVNDEVQTIENQGAEAILNVPREVLVYERGEEVIVAYRMPPGVEAIGGQEPTSELLNRVVRDATQPAQRLSAAEREQQQREQRAQADVQGDRDLDVNVDIREDQRQARAPQRRDDMPN